MSQLLTARPRSLSMVFVVAGFLSALVLLINAAKRAEILPLTVGTQLVAPIAQLAAAGLIIGIFAATPAMRTRLGSIGVVLYVSSLIGLVGAEFIVNLVFPYVDAETRATLLAGPIMIAFLVVSIAFLLGTIIFFAALWRTAGSPRIAIALAILSSVPIALRNVFPEVALQLGLAGLAIAIAMLTVWLLRKDCSVAVGAASKGHAIA
jgi:hypothetical protein